MDSKLDTGLPEELDTTHWKPQKEAFAALEEAGVTAALAELSKRYAAFDFGAFSAAKLTTAADAQKRLDAAQAVQKKSLKPLLDLTRAAEASARKALAGFKSKKLDAKKGPAAAQDIIAAATRFATVLPPQLDAAIAALEDRLADLLAEEEKAAAKKGAGGKDAGSGAPATLELSKPFVLLRKKAIEGLRLVKNTPPPMLLEKPVRYLAGVGAKACRVYIARSVSGSQRNLLKGLMPGEPSVKFFVGDIIWEAKAHTFVGAQIPGGFAKKLQRALLEQTKGRFRVRARKLDGEGGVDEEAGDADPDQLDDTSGEVAAKPAAPGTGPRSTAERVAELQARLTRLKPELDAAIALKGPRTEAMKTARDAIQAHLKALKVEPAAALLAKLEDVVLMTTAQAAGEEPPAEADAPGGKADAKPADPPATSEGQVDEYLEITADYMASVKDAKVSAPILARLGKLTEAQGKAKALTDQGKREAAFKTMVAPSKKLVDDASKVALADMAQVQAAQARAAADAQLGQITALVLGALGTADVRDKINAELKKLQAGLEKADKLGSAAARLKAYEAIKAAADALHERAENADTSEDFAGKDLEPLFAAAAKAASGLETGKARTILMDELQSLRSDADRYQKAGDATALQSIIQPRLAKLARVSQAIPKIAVAVDRDIAEADKLIQPMQATASADLRARLAALQDQRANDFPAGTNLDELDGEDKLLSKSAKTLVADAQNLVKTLNARAEIAKLRLRVNGLKPRLDKASEAGQPKFVEDRQAKVRDALANFEKFEKLDDLKSCEIAFSAMGAALDAMEQAKRLYVVSRGKFVSARDGGIRAAKAAKLTPASLATLRDKALDAEGARIEALLSQGQLVKADKAVDIWLKQAKTWAKAPAAYNNMRSGHPVKGAMKDLINEPGGGEVFDAIVADLPEGTTTTETMTDAIDARFGVAVTQFDHRGKGSNETKPKDPQKGLKDLFRILRMVPVKDVKTIERITDYTQETGASETSFFSPGTFNDDIVMMAGRPSDGDHHPTGDPATIVSPKTDLDPRAALVGGGPIIVNYYTHTVLHEVAHGLDDEHGVMKSHMGEAGWEDHSVGDIAEVVAKFYGYDAGYVKSLLKNNAKPPKQQPKRPKDVKTDKAWTDAQAAVERWALESVVGAKPWDHPDMAKRNAVSGRVYHESYEGDWVSYKLSSRSLGISAYQFRSKYEWFADLYAAFYLGKLSSSHPATPWLEQLKQEAEA